MKAATDVFLRCQKCKKVLFSKEFEKNLFVCPHCEYHHRLSADKRIRITFDENSFQELDSDLQSTDPLGFPEYKEKLAKAAKTTGKNDPVVRGIAKLEGLDVAVAVSDFSFMGGSMGSVAGEKIARTLDLAAEDRIPAIIFTATGGARMQEGLLSLMQMAKTTGCVQRLSEAGAPFICVFTDPTMAGVLASYASLADIIIAEPHAQVGFAGARVSAQAGVTKVPGNFQTSEFNYQHGMIDLIVKRKDIRSTLSLLTQHLTGRKDG